MPVATAPVASTPLMDPNSGSSVSKIGYFLALTTVALVFSRLIEFLPDFVTVLHPAILLMGFGSGIALLSGGVSRVTGSRVTTFLALFTVWAVAGLPFSVWRGGAVRTFLSFWVVSLLAYFIITSMIVTLNQCRSAMLVLAAAILVVLFLGFFRGSDEDAGQLGRFAFDYGNLRNQNILAMILLMGLPFCAMAMSHWHGVRRILATCGVGLIGISIVRTGSRSGLLAFGIVMLFIFWRASMGDKLKLLVAGSALALLAVAISSEGALVRFKTVFVSPTGPMTQEEATAIDSTVSRAVILHRSLVQTMEHPLLGVGVGQFMVADKDAAVEEHTAPMWRVTHNSYTQLSSETGIPGLLFYSAAMLLCFRKLKALRRAARNRPEFAAIESLAHYLRLALIAYVVCSFFASTAYECYFPILAALTVSLDAAAWREINEYKAPPQPVAAPPLPRPLLRRATAV